MRDPGVTRQRFNFVHDAIGMISSVVYFLLTYEHSVALRAPIRIWRLLIMIGLGA